MTYTFRHQIVIDMAALETEIQLMQEQLESWNNHWKEIEEMPLLSLFSRGYLLQLLADLIGRNKLEDVVSY